jgi:hypothetical protein
VMISVVKGEFAQSYRAQEKRPRTSAAVAGVRPIRTSGAAGGITHDTNKHDANAITQINPFGRWLVVPRSRQLIRFEKPSCPSPDGMADHDAHIELLEQLA